MKVCLIYPPNFFDPAWQLQPDHQLFYLYSYLRQHAPSVQVEILNLTYEIGPVNTSEDLIPFLEGAEALLKRSGFDVAGISCWTTMHYPSTMLVAQLCRRLNPDGTLMVGGWHPTFVPEDFCEPDSPFDYVVRGEGEKPLLDIVTGAIPPGRPPQVIQGIPLPMDAYELAWGEHKHHSSLERMIVWLSRGCPFSCTYCSDRLSNYRVLSPRASVAMCKQIVRTYPNIKTIFFYDPVFGLRKDWRREFLTLLREADLPVQYYTETRVDVLEKEDVDLLASLSLRLDMGLESVVPEMLTIMKKTTNPQRYLEQWREVDDYMNQKHIPRRLNHIYNHPGETSRTLTESLNFWETYFQQDPEGCYAVVCPGQFALFPGSETFSNWQEYQQKYGASILNKEWWKVAGFPDLNGSTDIVASRELAESQQLHLPIAVANRAAWLSHNRANLAVFRPFKMHYPRLPAQLSALTLDAPRYFRDKTVGLSARVHRYRSPNGTIMLYHHGQRKAHPCDEQTSRWLEALLAGHTLAELDGELEPSRREQLQHFFQELLDKEMLRVVIPPPPEQSSPLPAGAAPGDLAVHPLDQVPAEVARRGCYRLLLRTSRGEVEVELYPTQAPRAVAGLLYLAARKFYDGQLFVIRHPNLFVELGSITQMDDGPGYLLPLERTDQTVRCGAVAMVHVDEWLHGSRFRLYRRDAETEQDVTVVGQVVSGRQALDTLIVGDYLISLEVVTPVLAAGQARPATEEPAPS